MNRARLVPLAGILAVVAIIIAFVVGGETPDGDDSLHKIVSFYRDHDSDQVWAAVFLGWATALFMMFAAGLWRIVRLAERERYGASALLLAGAAIWTVGATIFGGITFTLGDFADDLTPTALQTLNALNEDMFLTLAIGTFAFTVGAGMSVLNTGVLPKWMGWVAIAIGVIAVTPLGFFAFLAMGLWIVVASVILLLRGEPSPAPAAP